MRFNYQVSQYKLTKLLWKNVKINLSYKNNQQLILSYKNNMSIYVVVLSEQGKNLTFLKELKENE